LILEVLETALLLFILSRAMPWAVAVPARWADDCYQPERLDTATAQGIALGMYKLFNAVCKTARINFDNIKNV
jgi:hypothetical protein